MLKIKFIVIFILFLSGAPVLAQDTFIIEGDTLELTREVKGPLSLYWNEEGGKYRFFIQKGDNLVELKNESLPGEHGKRFRSQLDRLTGDVYLPTGDVKFLLYSLKHFVNRYNAKVQEDYTYNVSTSNIMQRVGLFVGLSNNKYTRNPENVLAPVLGLEYELYDPNLARRHSAFFHLRQSFEQKEYRYSSTQLSLNYRFRFLYFNGSNIHIDTELVNFYYSEEDIFIQNEAGETTQVREESGFSLTAPLSFGIGADIKISDRGFITLSYNDVVSIILDGNGSFPIDFTVGYRYSL